MNKKCLYSLSIVIAIFITAAVAFIFSVIQSSADQIDRTKEPSQTELLQEVDAAETEAPTQTPEITTETGETEDTSSKVQSADWDSDEAYLLAKIAMAEAEGEDTKGKALVMLVVLNRVWDNSFPDSIEEVIFQDGQFSPVSNGRFDSVEPNEDCYAALDLIESGWDESHGATYFESKSASTWHSKNLKYLFKHGNHYFYADKE